MKTDFSDKEEAINQWTHDPCGFAGGKDVEIGSREFYERIDTDRYKKYMPWMDDVINFRQFQGKKLLEIGFGMGTDLFRFSMGGADVYGVDLVPRHLEIASKRFSQFGKQCDLRIGDVTNLPFESNSFDAVYSFGVVHHIQNVEQAIGEIYRVLKPGGKAIIGVYHRNSVYFLCSVLLPYLTYRFVRESFKGTLARIEYREHNDACPYIKVYSRKELTHILKKFTDMKIECTHVEMEHLWVFRHIFPKKWLDTLKPRFGWYLIASGTKV